MNEYQPLTLAMIDGFLALVGSVHYVLPLAVVSECIDVPPECRQSPNAVSGTFDLRGEVLPYIDLARFYIGKYLPYIFRVNYFCLHGNKNF